MSFLLFIKSLPCRKSDNERKAVKGVEPSKYVVTNTANCRNITIYFKFTMIDKINHKHTSDLLSVFISLRLKGESFPRNSVKKRDPPWLHIQIHVSLTVLLNN